MSKIMAWRVYIVLLVVLVGVNGCGVRSLLPTRAPESRAKQSPAVNKNLAPTKTGAVKFARRYWGFARGRKFARMFDSLSDRDRRLVDRETFFHRTYQQNEFVVTAKVISAQLDGDEATVTIQTQMDYDLSTERISQTQRLVFDNGRWFPKLDGADLLFYGAKAKELGIERAKKGSLVRLPTFSAAISEANAFIENGVYYVSINLEILNSSDLPLDILAKQYFALVGPEQLISEPTTETGGAERIAVGAGRTVAARIDFPASQSGEAQSLLLVGQDPDLVLVPLDL